CATQCPTRYRAPGARAAGLRQSAAPPARSGPAPDTDGCASAGAGYLSPAWSGALRRYGTVPTDSRQYSGRYHCPPVRSSADQPRNAAVQLVGELDQLAYQPETEKDDGDEGEQQARQEAQRLLVDLGSGLKYRYHETDQQTGHHYRRDYGGGQPERLAEQIHCYVRCHCSVSSMEPEPL